MKGCYCVFPKQLSTKGLKQWSTVGNLIRYIFEEKIHCMLNILDLHFISLINIEMVQVVEIFHNKRQAPFDPA